MRYTHAELGVASEYPKACLHGAEDLQNFGRKVFSCIARIGNLPEP